MSVDPKNMGNITCGLVADPEVVNNNILKMRVAVDFAGRDSKDSANKSGYFNVTYFMNDDSPNAKFVAGQIKDGKMKKGSQLQIAYRLVQERWEKDGKNNSTVVLVAEAITYAGGARPEHTRSGEENSEATEPRAQVSVGGSAPTEF